VAASLLYGATIDEAQDMTQLPEVNLQAPGAGLPWWELTALRWAFRYARVTTSDERAMREFRREADRILSLVDGLDDQQGSKRVLIRRITAIEDSSRFWSVFMALDHLRIVNNQIIEIVEMLLSEEDPREDFLIEDVKPKVDAGPEAVGAFESCVRRYESRLSSRESMRSARRHVHPWFGPIDAHAWHCLAGIHHAIHRRQIVRILRGLTG
jgi:hypothetical protein